MNKKSKIFLNLFASVMFMQTLPVSANAEIPALYSEHNYKANSIEEVAASHSGENYIHLSGDAKNLRLQRYGEKICNMDNTGKIHTIIYYWGGSDIKIKKGTELPLEKLGTAIIDKIDDEHYVLNSDNEKSEAEKAITILKECDNVLAISNNYRAYEDTKNYSFINGFYYKGNSDYEDIIANNSRAKLTYVDLKEADSKIYSLKDEYDAFFITEANYYGNNELYDMFSTMIERGDSFECSVSNSALAVFENEADVYSYCQDAVIINGIEGDANIDGDTDISDSVMIMQSIANPDKYGLKAPEGITRQGCVNADTNGDGITNADALTIQKKLLKLE